MTPIGTIIRDAWYQIGLVDRVQTNHGSIEIYQKNLKINMVLVN